ncbi:Zinc finger protein [Pseudolycoriella hygida]|uniref:Zinc finger protein n=1 Tax=Pseudolycoriella hygida TaxID=35572 RepID=A0A9Q0NAP4_9DIPT|nr:Zinc finger protein [Pseudolycoriella hygida]
MSSIINQLVIDSMDDFSKMCRCCASQSDELSPINQCGATDVNIPNMFKECFDLDIDCSSLLPHSICSSCYEKLLHSVEFKKLCVSSFTFLTEFLEKQNISLIKNENFDDDAYNSFTSCLNDDMSDDTKPDVLYDCDVQNELPKKNSPKKRSPRKIKSIVKLKIKKSKETSIVDDEAKRLPTNDDSSEEKKGKNAKEKKEKVGKMCQICGQIFKSLQAHLYVHDIYPKFECNICNKKFRHKANVLSHMKIHTNQRDFKCHQCPYKTQFRTSYLRHLQTHTNERNFKCTICDKLFTRKMTLDRHKLTHDLPRVPCPHCDKMFTTKKGLVNHIGIHTGERPFKCKICDMGFVATSSLSVHRRIHKKEDDLLRCRECGLVLANLQMLYNHMKDHSVPSTSEMFATEVEITTTSIKRDEN